MLIFILVLLVSNVSMPYSLAQEDTDFIQLSYSDTGDDVIMLQLRLKDLGYYNYKITNTFGTLTESALKEFQKISDLSKDGILGEKTYNSLYSNAAKRKPIVKVVKPTPTPRPRSSSSSSGTKTYSISTATVDTSNIQSNFTGEVGALRDWFTYVNQKISRGVKIKVYAIDTGITFYITRLGGSNHADVEPSTAADTAAFFKAHGNVWNWDRIAVVVTIDGEKIAASMNGNPHSVSNIKDNNFNGHCCMHFLNSRTHNTNSVDSKHQVMVQKAAGQ